jgi:hypothetical protein
MVGDDPTITEHLADAYTQMGRESEALRLYRDALRRSEDTAQKTRLQGKVRAMDKSSASRL